MPTDKSKIVYRELVKKGFDEALCKEIAYKYMTTELYRNTYAWLSLPNDRAA